MLVLQGIRQRWNKWENTGEWGKMWAPEANMNLESRMDGQCLPCGSWLSLVAFFLCLHY